MATAAATDSPPAYGLPPLPSLPCPDFRGPTPWSNWCIKGRLLAGVYWNMLGAECVCVGGGVQQARGCSLLRPASCGNVGARGQVGCTSKLSWCHAAL